MAYEVCPAACFVRGCPKIIIAADFNIVGHIGCLEGTIVTIVTSEWVTIGPCKLPVVTFGQMFPNNRMGHIDYKYLHHVCCQQLSILEYVNKYIIYFFLRY